MEQYSVHTPNIKYLLPTAPIRAVTAQNGVKLPAWYNIESVGDRFSQTYDGKDDSRKAILYIVEQEKRLGIPSERIIIAGFSQGGSLSMYIGYSAKQKFAAIISLSGALLNFNTLHKDFSESANKDTELLYYHGDQDKIIEPKWAVEGVEALTSAGAKVEFHLVPGMGHTVNQEEYHNVLEYIQKNLA